MPTSVKLHVLRNMSILLKVSKFLLKSQTKLEITLMTSSGNDLGVLNGIYCPVPIINTHSRMTKVLIRY